MHFRSLTVVLLLAPLSLPAFAQERADQGFTFGARVGYAHPVGDLAANATTGAALSLADEFERAIPLVVEGGYRFSGITVGLYYQYGFASVADQAPVGSSECVQPGNDCDSGKIQRLGAQVLYSFRGGSPLTPWIGAGAGWEWASFDASDPTGSGTITYRGFELLAQGGAEWALSPRFFVGPYVSATMGRYSEVEIESGGASASLEFDEKRWHGWLQAGVRARFDL